ncbi:modular serine protease [Nilaparvata lugens]|uniref:modular serine protease n=1 Tax=Nilaparvata lugens TaxID=108931 RepID=UPI00193D9E5E|nr:modular serine protease [Nilaparvata lugens]XP_039282375.1 modular serine protease [Nilaparvata lugens]
MRMLIMDSDLVTIRLQGKFFVFLIILLVSSNTIGAAQLVQGSCSDGFVTCENGECISGWNVCDGTANCSDGSDEIQPICMNISCPANSFRCASGGCVDVHFKCNGQNDCADQSDELSLSCGVQWLTNSASPPCREDQFQCRNGECIAGKSLCDGEINCSDRSDESILACYDKLSCPPGSFRCAYGGCISANGRCNSRNDCADGSDEHYLLCNRPKPEPVPLDLPGLQKPPPTKPSGRNCVVPEHEHTHLSRLQCKVGDCGVRQGELVSDEEYFLLTCDSPYYTPLNVGVVKCANGVWIPEKHICQRRCKPYMSSSLEVVSCLQAGRAVNCSEEVPVGTVVRLQCRDGYETHEGLLVHSIDECLKDGTWLYKDKIAVHCFYRCGILYKPPRPEEGLKPLIFGGSNSIAINHPWNVGLYYFDRAINKYNFFCGGTLVSPFTVLSAAHCFVNGTTGDRLVASDVWVALAKTKREWSSEELRVQKIQVENFYIPERYAAHNLSFLNDIAVIELRTQAKISRSYGIPMPACLANPKNKLNQGAIGLLAGWGENDAKDKDILQAANFTYQPYHKNCREHANNTILADHFCAYIIEENGSINQPSVSFGDSGSGFIHEINGNHFIYGVTSTKKLTTSGFTLSSFTDVTHSDICQFVRKKVEMINKKHSNFGFSRIPCE